jgi:hypothetical protein
MFINFNTIFKFPATTTRTLCPVMVTVTVCLSRTPTTSTTKDSSIRTSPLRTWTARTLPTRTLTTRTFTIRTLWPETSRSRVPPWPRWQPSRRKRPRDRSYKALFRPENFFGNFLSSNFSTIFCPKTTCINLLWELKRILQDFKVFYR